MMTGGKSVDEQKQIPGYIDGFFLQMASDGRKSSSIKAYSSGLNKFVNWLDHYKGDISLSTLESLVENDYAIYLKYLEEKKFEEATIRRLTMILNRLLTYLSIDQSIIRNYSKTIPVRKLTKNDFISQKEWEQLYRSIKTASIAPDTLLTARDYLLYRNAAIVLLMRFYGLTPSEIFEMDMASSNFAQNTFSTNGKTINLEDQHKQVLIDYLQSIKKLFRPRYHTDDPLFVAFNNKSMAFQYDYQIGVPKRLSVRGIQEMVKKEVKRAGLRKLSAINFRNQSILDHLSKNNSDQDAVVYYGFSGAFSLYRFKKYMDEQAE
jgi:site-specific recombinase XerD